MKKISYVLPLLLLFFTVNVSAAKNSNVYVSVNSSRVRSGPGTSFESLKVIPNGYKLRIISEEELWYKVLMIEEGQEGWILKRNVTYETPQTKRINKLKDQLQKETLKKEALIKKISDDGKKVTHQKTRIKSLENSILHLRAENKALEKSQFIVLLGGAISLLLLGWGLGFITGTYRRKANERKYLEMMLDAHPSTQHMVKKKKAGV